MSDYSRLRDYIQAARDAVEDAGDYLGRNSVSAMSAGNLVRDLVQLELEANALRMRIRENHAQVPAGD
jgi:hypothetical protein